jgi:D-cysteine desulfhydrase
MTDYLGNAYPGVAAKLRKSSFASLPTPVSLHELETSAGVSAVTIKRDDQTSSVYGGNKVRKLEYLFQRAIERGAKRVATFGAVGSNHALATATFAQQFKLGCTCFLAHQRPTPNIPRVLNMHLKLGTEIVRYGSAINQVALFRRYIQNRETWVIPLGGSCWLGAVGFVNAGLELAAQIEAGDLTLPERIYIANGSMGSAAGLAVGLALAELPIELHAVRVADNSFSRPEFLHRLIRKTATLLHQLDENIPVDVSDRVRLTWRDDFYAGGYAAVDDTTMDAVETAKRRFGLRLETTYTGKAMAALLHDLKRDARNCLFWNTYSSNDLPVNAVAPQDTAALPNEFLRYFDAPSVQ